MAVQIQLRRGTAAQWASANPTLASGEVGIETDTNKQKVGDGTTAWNSLAYFNVNGISFGTTGLTPSTSTAGNVTVAGTLNVANGGTGVTTSTGTGSNVLNTSPTLTTPVFISPALGTPTSGSLVATTNIPVANATGTLAVVNGGTGLISTPANGALDIGNGSGFTRTTLTAGTNVTITNGAGSITIAATGGGGGTPGGSTTQVQYNNAGALAGSANMTFDGTTFTVASRGIAKAGMPAGSVIQTVQTFISGKNSTTNTTYTTLAAATAFTPTSATSKVLIIITCPIGNSAATGNADFAISKTVGGTTTQIVSPIWNAAAEQQGAYYSFQFANSYLDSPATTSPITYAIQGKQTNGLAAPFVGGRNTDSSYNTGTYITLMEIAA